ncbi:hypothetical protein GC163_07165 [bacterium]|nr:hypothetical protein [bacterium]
MRTLGLLVAALALLSLSLLLNASARFAASEQAEVVQLTPENWESYCPAGKEIDAIYGDYVLRNDYLTAVIAQPLATRNANLTTKDIGGGLLDLTLRHHQNDQLTVFLPGRRAFPYRQVEILSADSQGSLKAQTDASSTHGAVVGLTMIAEGSADRPEVRTTYKLAAGQAPLVVESVYRNASDKPLTVKLEDDFRADGQKEDMIRTPNGTVSAFWLQDRYWGQAYGLTASDRQLQLNSDAKTSQIKYVDTVGQSEITLKPGEQFTLSRTLIADANILGIHARQSTAKVLPVTLQCIDSQGKAAGSDIRVELLKGETLYGTAATDNHGQVTASLPTGEYTVRFSQFGVSLADDALVSVKETEKQQFDFKLPRWNFGTLSLTAVDGDQHPIPCKVEIRPHDAELKLDFGPETAEYAVRNLCYGPKGAVTQALPPGSYDLVISHGPEYDIAKATVEIQSSHSTRQSVTLPRTVNTKGWVSSDFHSHSSPSGDNTSSQLGRVINLVCEHVEFAPCTEHQRIDSYQPHIEALGIGKFISSVTGIELTGQPLPLNHQNSFPLIHHPHTQNGGGPENADNLETQIERLALWDNRSEKLVQVNHPDIGWMFYDKNGDGEPDAGYERAFPYMDVMEIHPVDHALDLAPYSTFPNGRKFHNTVFRWLQLLNQGYRIYGVVNTDAHYNFHGSGPLRNWIQSTTDEPSEIQYMDMVHASEQGRLVMSNGPFLEVWAVETGRADKVTAGQDLITKSKKVSLKVRAEAPNWIDIDRLFVLVNGRIHPVHNYFRNEHPQRFQSGAVKFEGTLDIELTGDAHLIVVTGDLGGSLGDVYGDAEKYSQPAALSNPIFVDVDGNGFTPNKDTLDAALPVKFGTAK